jgi:hypothetical protein
VGLFIGGWRLGETPPRGLEPLTFALGNRSFCIENGVLLQNRLKQRVLSPYFGSHYHPHLDY